MTIQLKSPTKRMLRQRPTIAALAVLAAGFLLATSAYAIIGGTVDFYGHPYVGAIDSTAHGAPIVTSGVLISPTVLLTPGHVTRKFDVSGLTRARGTFHPGVSASSPLDFRT